MTFDVGGFPVLRSAETRRLVLATAAVTIAIILWVVVDVARHPSPFSPIFYFLFVGQDTIGAVWALIVLALAAVVPSDFPARRFLRLVSDRALILAAIAAALMMVGSHVIYRNHPLSMDEYAAFFQSQAFASGHLAGHFPPALIDQLVAKPFQNYFLVVSTTTGQVASAYWPSFALLLTPFTWLGIPWACNPLISAATLLVLHRISSKVFASPEAAGLTILLTAASPVFWANGISYYSMPAHLLANSVFVFLLLDPRPLRAVAAGFVGSIALTLHNPVPHALFAAPWIIHFVRRRDGLRPMLFLMVGYAPLCFLLGGGWFEYLAHIKGADQLPAISGNLATTVDGAFALPTTAILLARLAGIAKTCIWAVPGIVLLASIGSPKGSHPALQLVGASAALTVIGYMFVPFDQGHGWGFRYFHSAWMAVPLLATSRLLSDGGRTPHANVTADRLTYVTACALLTLCIATPLRLKSMQDFVTAQLGQAPMTDGALPAVLFINISSGFYASDLVQNRPFLSSDYPVRLISSDPATNARIIQQHFPGFQRISVDKRGELWIGPSSNARKSPYGH